MQEVEEALGGDPVLFDVLKILTSDALIASLNNMASGDYSLVTTPIEGGYMLSIMGASEGASVPEPAAWVLLLMGVLGMASVSRLKGHRASQN